MSTQNPIITLQSAEERDRDLGFGSVVSQARNLRLLNRDGSFNVRRKQNLSDAYASYYSLLTMSWTRFIGLVVALYVAINGIFALAYVLCGDGALQAISSSFQKAFFFSIETFSTIGYGNIVPVTLAANVIVCVEAVSALLSFALATGLIFARFSRPTAKVLFSDTAIIAPYNGVTAF